MHPLQRWWIRNLMQCMLQLGAFLARRSDSLSRGWMLWLARTTVRRVLRSQAEPGVSICQVALRRTGADLSDLIPAHVRAPMRRVK